MTCRVAAESLWAAYLSATLVVSLYIIAACASSALFVRKTSRIANGLAIYILVCIGILIALVCVDHVGVNKHSENDRTLFAAAIASALLSFALMFILANLSQAASEQQTDELLHTQSPDQP
jgi:hypothetical protein